MSHVELYSRYLSLLAKLRDDYGVLEKAAYVDMALWSASRLWKEMLHDLLSDC